TPVRLRGEVVARLKAILDQMSQWESFVDVVNQVAEGIKMQKNVLQAAEKARESRTLEVFDGKPWHAVPPGSGRKPGPSDRRDRVSRAPAGPGPGEAES